MPQLITLNVNGRSHTVEVEPETPLLYVLRNDLLLNGPKFGCGLEQCGSCMALVDGEAVPTCRLPASEAEGRAITTLEGLGTKQSPHPIQKAFIAEQAAQCGFCINGMIVRAKALLDREPDPSEAEIREELARVLCRCGTHARILRAVQRAARERAR